MSAVTLKPVAPVTSSMSLDLISDGDGHTKDAARPYRTARECVLITERGLFWSEPIEDEEDAS